MSNEKLIAVLRFLACGLDGIYVQAADALEAADAIIARVTDFTDYLDDQQREPSVAWIVGKLRKALAPSEAPNSLDPAIDLGLPYSKQPTAGTAARDEIRRLVLYAKDRNFRYPHDWMDIVDALGRWMDSKIAAARAAKEE